MSRGQHFARFTAGIASALEVDIGPVDDQLCEVGRCDADAVYRVPYHSVGGDVAYCPFHLARYRARHTELFDHVDDIVDEDLTALAVQGDRFLSLDDVPEYLRDGDFRAVALLVDGAALFEEVDPGAEVTYFTVDRSLEEQSQTTVPRGNAGTFLSWVNDHLGVHEWDDEVEKALFGGESA